MADPTPGPDRTATDAPLLSMLAGDMAAPAASLEPAPAPAPTHLNPINSSAGFHSLSVDKLTLRYLATNLHGHDVGVAQANCPAPSDRLVYYFEIFVKSAGDKGQISIGFTSENFKMRRQPGWEINSYGYHGDDGQIYRGLGKGEQFGPKFGAEDTVGGGINYATQEFFFTKNGQLIGTVPKDVKCPLYPTVAVHSRSEEVVVNFGQDKFKFDIEGYIAEQRQKQKMLVEKESAPLSLSHSIIRSYLLHYGYQDTYSAFDTAVRADLNVAPAVQENGFTGQETYEINHRKILRQLITNGDVDAAFDRLREWYPQLVKDESSMICFMLYHQKFIELIRVGHLETAISYAQSTLARFFDDSRVEIILKDVCGLLAYEDPEKSRVGYLLGVTQREATADAVNLLVLSTNPSAKDLKSCAPSVLEKLLKQLLACCYERRSLNSEQGEPFDLQKALTAIIGDEKP